MERSKPWDSDQITRDYFDSLLVEMRHIDAVAPSTKYELYGEIFDTPIMMAALSHLGKIRENGMVEMAKGALAANAVNWAGMGDEAEIAAITVTGARTINIIKPYADNGYILQRIEHAANCGVFALGMDVDHAFGGNGKYQILKMTEELAARTCSQDIKNIDPTVICHRNGW